MKKFMDGNYNLLNLETGYLTLPTYAEDDLADDGADNAHVQACTQICCREEQ